MSSTKILAENVHYYYYYHSYDSILLLQLDMNASTTITINLVHSKKIRINAEKYSNVNIPRIKQA